MASEIPALGSNAPRKLTTISNFVVAKGSTSTFPSDFLPNGTEILIQPNTGGKYDLFWNNQGIISCSVPDLGPEPTGPDGNLSGENVCVTIDGTPRSAAVQIFPIGSVGSVPNVWVGIIVAEDSEKINTPTTGTFVAQASTDGGGHPHKH